MLRKETLAGRDFVYRGSFDFSLIGILSEISGILADHKIGIFLQFLLFNTDYIMTKQGKLRKGIEASSRRRV